jgi:hypothetical protein
MTTHVFIVDNITFKLHLEYLFSGTGAKESVIDFNNSDTTNLNTKTEDNLVGMMADASRVRSGDLIIFYLQQNFQQKIFDGKFFGIFKVKEHRSFLDNNNIEQYLKEELEKSLTFRTFIEPYQVYQIGVTEWEALDDISNIQSPNQMLWSLIYRKLKGNRGNSMITIYESERLCQLIRDKNVRETLNTGGRCLSFNSETQKIFLKDQAPPQYQGRQENFNILPRLLYKLSIDRVFEIHLQAYITMNIGKNLNPSLDNSLLRSQSIEWLGNEVGCGVGMRKIDIMLSLVNESYRLVVPVELKCKQAEASDVQQLERYVKWIRQYYIPNRPSDIEPVILSRAYQSRNNTKYQRLCEAFSEFNHANNRDCRPLKYIEFDKNEDSLEFSVIEY